MKVILDVENVQENMECESLKHKIWQATMIIFLGIRVKREDISIEGCNMRRRSLQLLQATQRMPLRIRAYDYDIKNQVKVELESTVFRQSINTHIGPQRVTSVSDPIIYHFGTFQTLISVVIFSWARKRPDFPLNKLKNK